MPSHPVRPRRPAILTLLVALLPLTVAAQPAMPINPEQDLESLSQMRYCQWVLSHPSNQSRVYEYDTRRCTVALERAESKFAWTGDDVRAALDQRADEMARAIQARTSDVTQVIGACRQACQKLTPDFDQQAPATESSNQTAPEAKTPDAAGQSATEGADKG